MMQFLIHIDTERLIEKAERQREREVDRESNSDRKEVEYDRVEDRTFLTSVRKRESKIQR